MPKNAALMLNEIELSKQGATYSALYHLLVGVRETFQAREACFVALGGTRAKLIASSEYSKLPQVKARRTRANI